MPLKIILTSNTGDDRKYVEYTNQGKQRKAAKKKRKMQHTCSFRPKQRTRQDEGHMSAKATKVLREKLFILLPGREAEVLWPDIFSSSFILLCIICLYVDMFCSYVFFFLFFIYYFSSSVCFSPRLYFPNRVSQDF